MLCKLYPGNVGTFRKLNYFEENSFSKYFMQFHISKYILGKTVWDIHSQRKSIFFLLLLLTLLFFVFSGNNLTSWQQFLSAERFVHICDAFYIITLHFHREKQDSYWILSNMRDVYSWHLIRKLNSIEKVQSMEVVTRS